MSNKIVRGETYQLDDGKIVRLQKWSIGKFYSMLNCLGEVLKSVDVKFDRKDYDSVIVGEILTNVSKAAADQLTHIIIESLAVDQKIDKEKLKSMKRGKGNGERETTQTTPPRFKSPAIFHTMVEEVETR